MCIGLFFAFVHYQQSHRQKVFNWETLHLCRGVEILKFGKESTDLYYFTFHIWKHDALLERLSPPKPDWTGYHQTSILKTVLPNHVR